MKKLLRKPLSELPEESLGRYERFNLTENPFPSEPIVNEQSSDRRINGGIYETEIRRKEYNQILNSFLKRPQADLNHIRLGYIIDTSYLGRGNGKSAFLVNLQQDINRDFCNDLSQGVNKCFAIYVAPDPGGRTKTFLSFVDIVFKGMLRLNIVNTCLAIFRLEALNTLYPEQDLSSLLDSEYSVVEDLNSLEWFNTRKIDLNRLNTEILKNRFLQNLPIDFPIFRDRYSLLGSFVTQSDFEIHYQNIRKPKEKLEFIFSHLVRLFQAAGFNGAYVLVDDFERIPDWQSARQKRDFALELRSCLFDGLYASAKTGFYDILLALHAGVPRLISDAWTQSGMENRAPISSGRGSSHVIPFEKLDRSHATLLLVRYLREFRIDRTKTNSLFPFTEEAVNRIGEMSEFNAAKMLKFAYGLIEKAAEASEQQLVDEQFVRENKAIREDDLEKTVPSIEDAPSVNLQEKARGEN